MTILCVLEKDVYILLSLNAAFYIFQLDLSYCVMQIFYFSAICLLGLSVTAMCIWHHFQVHCTAASLLFLDQVENPASSGPMYLLPLLLEMLSQPMPLASPFISLRLSYKEVLSPYTLAPSFSVPWPLFIFFPSEHLSRDDTLNTWLLSYFHPGWALHKKQKFWCVHCLLHQPLKGSLE